MTTELGILDVGGARFKAAAWHWTNSPEPVWSEARSSGDLAAQGSAERLIENLRELIGLLRERCSTVIAYGGGKLRDAPWQTVLLPVIEDLADEAYVLSEHQEGALLALAARRTGVRANHLLDIGGSSVQLISEGGGGAVTVQSWPYGTHSLENSFGLVQGSTSVLYHEVSEYLIKNMEVRQDNGSLLAIGTSPWYRSLMAALAGRLGMRDSERWTVDDVERAWQYCAQLSPQECELLLPALPAFLRGADKGFLIAAIVAAKLGSSAVTVTDVTVMHGIAFQHFDRLTLADHQPA